MAIAEWLGRGLTLVLVALPAAATSSPLATDPIVPRGEQRAVRKGSAPPAEAATPRPVLATLVQVHTREHAPLDDAGPAPERFDELLADRTTGERITLDRRLLDLLRKLAAAHPGSRIELVSGYRSAKLNERMRKKGRNVASHSQHSLGHAVDFRVVPDGADGPLEPSAVEREVRALGWVGGVGIYPAAYDRFVHCDVGPNRRWVGH